MLADNKQIDKRTTTRNQNRSAALGRPAMKRDWLKLIDFDDVDHIYMAKHALSNIYLGYIFELVDGI